MTHDDSPTSPIDLPPPEPVTPAMPDPAAAHAAATPVTPQPTAPPPPPPGSAGPSPASSGAAASPPGGAPAPAQVDQGWGRSAPSAPSAQPGWSAASPAATAPARSPNQAGLVFGVLLLVVGGLLLVGRLADIQLENAWPLWIILPGLAMLIASFAVPPRGGLGLAVPGAVIATIGGILWVQDTYDAWQTWAYAWALVGPTAPGVGTLLYGLVKGDRDLVRDGARATVTGLALFAGFALFFEGVLGLSGEPIANLDDVLPFAIIGLGLLLLVASLVGGRRRERRAR